IRDGHVTGVQTCALPILFGGFALEKICLPAGAQPGGAVHHCTAVPVRAPTAIAISQGGNTRALLSLFDESRAGSDGRRLGLGVQIGRASCRERWWSCVGG